MSCGIGVRGLESTLTQRHESFNKTSVEYVSGTVVSKINNTIPYLQTSVTQGGSGGHIAMQNARCNGSKEREH